MPEITCKWCQQPHKAHNNNRRHCSRAECRSKEIEDNLAMLTAYLSMLLRHKIVAQVELRCPGNDAFGQQVKVTSECCVDHRLEKRVDEGTEHGTTKDELDSLVTYFRQVLQKKIKGNFVINTAEDGKVGPVVLNESFTSFRWPTILGGNLLISKNTMSRR